MGFLDFLRPKKQIYQTWKELGTYQSSFSRFGSDAFASETVRASVRALADYSSKSNCVSNDGKMAKLLNERPNMYMNGKDFLYKVRTYLELYNNCFILIERDDRGKVAGFYPIPYMYFDALEYANGLFIKFTCANGYTMTVAWEDLAVLRKDYNRSDIAGDDNQPIFGSLDLQKTINEGLGNSIKSTANLRGIIKNTKAMLSNETTKKQKDDFIRDYLNLENTGGIASLDATQEFIPVNMTPSTATYEQMKEVRENIYRYYGVNDAIVMGTATTEQLEVFYRLRIAPFLVALTRELTSKVFTGKASSYGNYISYEADAGEFLTMSQKIELYSKIVLYGGMSRNEWRRLMNYPPIEGGDEMIMRLDASSADVAMQEEDKND